MKLKLSRSDFLDERIIYGTTVNINYMRELIPRLYEKVRDKQAKE